MVTQTSDLLIANSAIEVVDKVLEETKNALARQLDNFLQTTVNGSSNGVNYAGGRASRATLGASDVFDTTLYNRCIRDMRKSKGAGGVAAGVKPFANGAYAVITHTSSAYDLRANTNSGAWADTARYSSPDSILKADLGHFNGGMVYESPNVQTYSSTVTVSRKGIDKPSINLANCWKLLKLTITNYVKIWKVEWTISRQTTTLFGFAL